MAATLPLLREKGRSVSTREIAAAAGVAEGTIFRVFESKDQLIEATLASAFEPGRILGALDAVDRSLPLRERLVAMVTVIQDRFVEVFTLMAALGMTTPPDRHYADHHGRRQPWRQHVLERMVALIEPDADQLRVSPEQVSNFVRLLTFAGSHPQITDNQLLAPEEIVDLLLTGLLKPRTTTTRGER
jgi:AcrR family transcriptional regulator